MLCFTLFMAFLGAGLAKDLGLAKGLVWEYLLL
jgi:hypothetical protein